MRRAPAISGKRLRANAAGNTKKYGIIGIPLLAKHLAFFHRGDAHMIDLALIAGPSAPPAPFFARIEPLELACTFQPLKLARTGSRRARSASPLGAPPYEL